MANNKKEEKKGFVATTLDNTKKFALNANELALNKTEQVVTDSLEIAAQWQGVAEKAIKGGLKLSSNQQELVFDILNAVKSDLIEGKKKFKTLVA